MQLTDSLLTPEMKQFLGEFTVESTQFQVGYVLKCKNGKSYFGDTIPDILKMVEEAYKKHKEEMHKIGYEIGLKIGEGMVEEAVRSGWVEYQIEKKDEIFKHLKKRYDIHKRLKLVSDELCRLQLFIKSKEYESIDQRYKDFLSEELGILVKYNSLLLNFVGWKDNTEIKEGLPTVKDTPPCFCHLCGNLTSNNYFLVADCIICEDCGYEIHRKVFNRMKEIAERD